MTDLEVYRPPRGELAERDVVDGWLTVASDVIKLANVIAETEFVPAEYRDSPPAVAAAILFGRELGIGPMMSLRHVQVVKGVPTLSAEYKRGRVLGAGHDFEIEELNTTRCKVRGRRTGTPKWLEVTFTIEDAKRAGLLAPSRSGKPGAWLTRPRRMLFARAGSELCDFLFADVTNGLPTTELVADGADGDEFAGYDEAPGQAVPAEAGNGNAPPAPRTARRRQAKPEPADRPTAAAPAPASGRATAQTAPSGDLPPLPGEEETGPTDGAPAAPGPSSTPGGHDAPTAGSRRPTPAGPGEPDYDTEGTVTRDQLTAMWATFSTDLGFGKDDKPEARKVCEKIIGRKLLGGTTGNLSRNEASACIDTLKRCRTRERLIVLMNDGELPDEGGSGE